MKIACKGHGTAGRRGLLGWSGSLALVTMVFFAVLASTPRTAHACSCVDVQLSEYADDVVVAFAGRQIERNPSGTEPRRSMVKYGSGYFGL